MKYENNKAGNDWIAQLAYKWEQAAYEFKKLGTRVVCMRISLLINRQSGFLKAMALSQKLGLGILFGKNSNIIEWIHIKDAVKFIVFSIENETIKGPYNIATENKITQKQFAITIKRYYPNYSVFITIPSALLSLIIGIK